VAWVVGWASQIPGFINAVTPGITVPSGCVHLYYMAFPLGFAISFTVYWGLNILSPTKGLGEVDDEDYFGTFGDADVIPGTMDADVSDGFAEEKGGGLETVKTLAKGWLKSR